MYITDHARSLVLSALIAYTSARQMVENLSFGHKETLSEDYRSIPGWKIFGDGHVPHLMSDRVILTPPYPGNQKGALWAESPAQSPGWFTDFYFRTSGPDRGGGSLHLWYTKDSQVQSPPIASLYTVRQFDGLVIVIDQYGGGGGSVRAFLNDGTTTFNTHPNLDSLAFGRCEYSYRNLGRLSRLRVTQTASYFQVEVDDRDCFRTEKVCVSVDMHPQLTRLIPYRSNCPLATTLESQPSLATSLTHLRSTSSCFRMTKQSLPGWTRSTAVRVGVPLCKDLRMASVV